jgi:methylglyoxal synthase
VSEPPRDPNFCILHQEHTATRRIPRAPSHLLSECFRPRVAQLLDFISAHKETIACFPLSVFAHMAATIRELLGPEASIVHEIVTKEMGADSAIATHMVLRAALRSMPHTSSLPTAFPPSFPLSLASALSPSPVLRSMPHTSSLPTASPPSLPLSLASALSPSPPSCPLYLSLERPPPPVHRQVLEDVGCIINLRNPFVTHPWACDTGSLVRLINVGNVLHASNPTTAASLIASFELALNAGKKLPLSFYKTLESPSVALYQKGQDAVIASCEQAERIEIDSYSCRACSVRVIPSDLCRPTVWARPARRPRWRRWRRPPRRQIPPPAASRQCTRQSSHAMYRQRFPAATFSMTASRSRLARAIALSS